MLKLSKTIFFVQIIIHVYVPNTHLDTLIVMSGIRTHNFSADRHWFHRWPIMVHWWLI